MRRVRFRILLPARVAHHRYVPGLRSHHSPDPTPPIPHINHRGLLTASSTPTTLTPAITQRTSRTIVVVVIAIILSRFTPTLRLAPIQTVQLLTQIVVTAVLMGIVPEVPIRGRSPFACRSRCRGRTERILVLELLAGTATVVQVPSRGGPRGRRGLPLPRRGTPLVLRRRRMMMVVMVVIVTVVILEVMVVIGHSVPTVQFRF